MSSDKPILEDESLSPLLRQRMTEPHLAIYLGEENGGWIAVVKGMVIALVTDRSKVDGIAPYVIVDMNWKPGREVLHLVAHGKPGTARRELKLGSKYKGHHTMSQQGPDEIVDAAINAKKLAGGE